MLTITLSGVLKDDCTVKTDKNNHSYIRFLVINDEPDYSGKPSVTIVRCYCYNMKYAGLKKGDFVFLSGLFKFSLSQGEVNADIFVQNISRGINY